MNRSEVLATISSNRAPGKSVPVFVTDIGEGGCRARTRKIIGHPGEVLRFELWLDQFNLPGGELVIIADDPGP